MTDPCLNCELPSCDERDPGCAFFVAIQPRKIIRDADHYAARAVTAFKGSETVGVYPTITAAGAALGVNRATVQKICKGKHAKTRSGYRFEYAEVR